MNDKANLTNNTCFYHVLIMKTIEFKKKKKKELRYDLILFIEFIHLNYFLNGF